VKIYCRFSPPGITFSIEKKRPEGKKSPLAFEDGGFANLKPEMPFLYGGVKEGTFAGLHLGSCSLEIINFYNSFSGLSSIFLSNLR
jgi:hypothetical protein